MTKREFDRITSRNHGGPFAINDRVMYRAGRVRGDALPVDRLAVDWRGLVPTWTPTHRGDLYATRRCEWYISCYVLPPGDPCAVRRTRYMLEMRKGNYDHYIGDSGFAAWSRRVTFRYETLPDRIRFYGDAITRLAQIPWR